MQKAMGSIVIQQGSATFFSHGPGPMVLQMLLVDAPIFLTTGHTKCLEGTILATPGLECAYLFLHAHCKFECLKVGMQSLHHLPTLFDPTKGGYACLEYGVFITRTIFIYF